MYRNHEPHAPSKIEPLEAMVPSLAALAFLDEDKIIRTSLIM